MPEGTTRRVRRGSSRARRFTPVALIFLLAGACSPTPATVATRRLAPLTPGEIRRIAVLPFTSEALPTPEPRERGQAPLLEPPADTVGRAMTEAMRRLPDWKLVDDLVVVEGFRALYGEVRAPTPGEAVAVGKLLGVDAVVRGQVTAFEERIGSEFGAQRTARVVFAVEVVRIPSGVALWQGEYAEQQQALSENLLSLPGFMQARGRWLRAGELAALGADRMAAKLHAALYGSEAGSSTTR